MVAFIAYLTASAGVTISLIWHGHWVVGSVIWVLVMLSIKIGGDK